MKHLAVSIPVLLALLSTACGGMKIALQEPVASAPAVLIEGKGKVLTMSGVTTERTKGGGVMTFSGSAGPWGGKKVKQNFEYTTSDGWSGSCAFASGGQTIAGFDIAQSGGMKCTINNADQSWNLDLVAVQEGGKRLVGTYGNGEISMDVRMSLDLEGSSFPLFIGYTLAAGGTGTAAVQVTGARQLWVVEGTDGSDAIKASVGAFVFSQPAVQQATQ